MSIIVKSKFNLCCHCSRWFLLIVGLLVSLTLVFSCFSSTFIGVSLFASGVSDKIVSDEFELMSAVNSSVGHTNIVLKDNIVLTLELRISAGKDITLSSKGDTGFKLVGADERSTIIVENNGLLKLEGIIVTHAKNAMAGE